MQKYRAIKTNYLTQGFDSAPSMVEFYKKYGLKNHGGYDFLARTGEGVFWDCDLVGTVLNNEIDGAGGLGVNVITEDNGVIYKHRFWHLKDFYAKAGDKVMPGDLLGWADNTGASTGSHLHCDIKQMGKNDNGSFTILNYDNGTFGTIRYWDRFTNTFILDTVIGKQNLIRKIRTEIIKRIMALLKK